MSKTKDRKKRLAEKSKYKISYPYKGTKEIRKEIKSLQIDFTHIEFDDTMITIYAEKPLEKIEEILLRNIVDKYDGE
jgi:helix-turn-helix protein